MIEKEYLTETVAEKNGLTQTELKLVSYLHYCILNQVALTSEDFSTVEHTILKRWRDEHKIVFVLGEPCTCTNEFWNFICKVLYDAYLEED